MKRLYFQLNTYRNQTKSLSFQEIKAKFYINNFEELRIVETVFDKGCRDERLFLTHLLQKLKQGETFYDIGANIGIYTIFISKRVGKNGKVIAFEPDNRNFKNLKQNISLNGLNNVVPIQVALGDNFNEGFLYIREKIGIDAVSLMKTDDSDFRQQSEIVPGDFLVQNRELPFPKAVKIDVEGYEYKVLKGLRETLSQDTCRLLCCEIHPKLIPHDISDGMPLDLIRSFGFTHIESYDRGSEIHAICYKH